MKKIFLVLLCAMGILNPLCGDAAAQQRIAASYPGIAGYNIPFWVGLDTGEFKKVGLDVDPVLISGGSRSMQALLSGGLDFAHVSGGVSVQAALGGAEVTIVATVCNSMSARGNRREGDQVLSTAQRQEDRHRQLRRQQRYRPALRL